MKHFNNIRLDISYDGSSFLGSQTQPNGLSVEDKLYQVLIKLNIQTKLIFAGRTDKGVHATHSVVNCLIPKYWDIFKLQRILNQMLIDIKINRIMIVDLDFHARYHAIKRCYRYIMTSTPLTPFNAKYLTYIEDIDEKLIKDAIKEFVGIFDFEYFSKKGSGITNFIREIYSVKFYRYKQFYIFKFCANGFLRSQIRIMVDFLIKISNHQLTIDQLIQQLTKQKVYSLSLAPSNGLYLCKVIYHKSRFA